MASYTRFRVSVKLRKSLGWYCRHGLAFGLGLICMLGRCSGQITTERLLDLPGQVNSADVSRDGRQVAFVWWPPEERRWGIYVQPIPKGKPELFAGTNDRGVALSPRWSPDGKWIAYLRSESTHGAILVVRASNRSGGERYLGVTCGDSFTWSADSGVVIASSRKAASDGPCELTAYPIMDGGGSRKLGVAGGCPLLSWDGRTLAFLLGGEIRLLPVTPQGVAGGSETIVTRESGGIFSLAWLPGLNQIAYVSSENLSVVRFVDVRGKPVASGGGEIDGEVLSLSSSMNGELLANVEVHSNSYWAIDLNSADLRPGLRRLLPWNVTSTAVEKSGDQLLYSISSGSSSQVYLSRVSDPSSVRLFETPYTVDSLRWSPDSKRIALIGHSGGEQIVRGHLYVTQQLGGAPEPFAGQLGSVEAVAWSSDGMDLLVAATTHDFVSHSVWKLAFDQSGLSKIADLEAQEIAVSSDGRDIYLRQRPSELIRIPIAGGTAEVVASGVLGFAVGKHELYIERQDSRPPSAEGLSLYRIDLPEVTPQFVAKLPFIALSMSLFANGRQLGMERRDPPQERLVRIEGWRK